MGSATSSLTISSAILIWLAACGSEVAQTQPAAGGTGAVGASGGAGNTGAGNTGNLGGDASGGSGNTGNRATESVCEQACAHATRCGFDVCTQFGLVCDGDAYACEGQCLLDTECEDLGGVNPVLIACVQACQGGGGAGGGAAQACAECVQPCFPQGCIQDAACQAWGLCSLNCTDPACFDQCDADNPGAAAFYGPFYECACTTCDAECGTFMDPCAGGGGGGSGGGGAGGAP